MSNLKKTVYKELFSSHKIDLNSVKDLEKTITDLKGNFSVIETEYSKLANELSQAENRKRALLDTLLSTKSLALNVAPKEISNFKQKAKDLGVDVSNVSQIKELEKMTQTTKEYDKLIQSIGKIPNL
jgi:t-SNARE complex subunit (syntaxin)